MNLCDFSFLSVLHRSNLCSRFSTKPDTWYIYNLQLRLISMHIHRWSVSEATITSSVFFSVNLQRIYIHQLFAVCYRNLFRSNRWRQKQQKIQSILLTILLIINEVLAHNTLFTFVCHQLRFQEPAQSDTLALFPILFVLFWIAWVSDRFGSFNKTMTWNWNRFL